MIILLYKYTQVVVNSIIIQLGITNQLVMEWGVLEMPLKPAGPDSIEVSKHQLNCYKEKAFGF